LWISLRSAYFNIGKLSNIGAFRRQGPMIIDSAAIFASSGSGVLECWGIGVLNILGIEVYKPQFWHYALWLLTPWMYGFQNQIS